ncbi:MAG: hypothetical protein WCV55_01095 [Candidatus Paceibacterota bacterium]
MLEKINKIRKAIWKFRYILLAVACFIFVTFSIFYFFWSKQHALQNTNIQQVKPAMTDEEKLKILADLAKAGTTTISVKQKNIILNNLKSKSTTTLTNDQKLQILENLKAKN